MAGKYISALRGYARLTKSPLDSSSLHESYANALNYVLTDPTAYAGQFLAVVDPTGKVDTYVVSTEDDHLRLSPIIQGENLDYSELYDLINEMNDIFDYFSYEDGVIHISAPVSIDSISVRTDLISLDTDVVNVAYLNSVISTVPQPIDFLLYPITNTGGNGIVFDVPGVMIERIVITITESFSVPLRLQLGDRILETSNHIQEFIYPGDDVSMTIIEINRSFADTGMIRVIPEGLSTTGSGFFSIIFKKYF
jgi:hypothetical protein